MLGLGECDLLGELQLGDPGFAMKQGVAFGDALSELQNLDFFQHETFVYPVTSVGSPRLLTVMSCKVVLLKIWPLSH